jgi:hypothetical protein
LEIQGNDIASIISMTHPSHRTEITRLLFSRLNAIDCATAMTIIGLFESDESKFEIIASSICDRNVMENTILNGRISLEDFN